MIPYKLRVQNFLSYRDTLQPLDFRGMHLVCLVGDNGHGKSALLDAITWALWGKARAKTDDQLIHANATEMQVEFEFELAGRRYNVIRKRLIGSRGRSELELAVWDERAAAWQALTEPSIRQTQERIEAILRMDYETFCHSAFLKQGEADAFTRKSPGERKDILARILNLSRYDAYAERAKALARTAAQEVARLEGEIQAIEAELALRPQYEQALERARLAETQARLAKSEAEQELTRLRAAEQELLMRRDQRRDLAQRLQQAQAAHAETLQHIQSVEQRLTELEALLAERQVIETGYASLQQARAEEAYWARQAQARRPLEQEQQRLQTELDRARSRLETELSLLRRERDEALQRSRSAPELESKAAQRLAEAERLEQLRQQRQTLQGQLAALTAERERCLSDEQAIDVEARSLKERLALLQAGGADVCPVCRQPLDATGRLHLEQEYNRLLDELRRRYAASKERRNQLQAEEARLQTGLKTLDREIARLSGVERFLGELNAALQQARQAQQALPELEERMREGERRLAQGDFAHEVRARLAAIADHLAAIPYDEQAHAVARATISDLQGLERRYAELQTAQRRIAELSEQHAHLQARRQREEAQLAADRQMLQQLDEALRGLPELQNRLHRQQQVCAEAQQAWEKAQAQRVAAEQRLKACAELVTTKAAREKELAARKARVNRYERLGEAFGPRGVQALIIEAALPELETEANRLLARLSDGRMSLRLQTQRELKSGALRETLDILIADELGQRPYEMFSGGEAFRTDLALRIALSRLLARRAGAALQTLFIDEGFGTQDAQGRENLVEAIHMIKDEFALIVVVTHIDELKEQFPVRIHVTKHPGHGSQFQVV